MTTPKYCILCENYKQHPCACAHCEDFDEFKISKSGKSLISSIEKQFKDKSIEALEENEKLKQELKEVKQELATFKVLC